MGWDPQNLLARSALFAGLRDQISALVDGDFPVVARARGRGAYFYGAAREFVGDAGVDAGFGGCGGGQLVVCGGG